ncbi:hypothetical protein GCM10025867_50970 (plasmid) [Frondihabitans sucicola]|uniref:Uncharacterized protein n=1 Tax=Frondihabitans sucicola TaxID=1268041 RepID=A0ABM8GWL3_9MICO|nr:hypothetical protein [Frondihabitans sucicola]BDZ52856.1 hypothetical protein GCM10025867_50970 [Frondihabitans sucicola]
MTLTSSVSTSDRARPRRADVNPEHITIPRPEVAHRAESQTMDDIVSRVAWNIRHGYDMGGSNVTAMIAGLLDDIDETLDRLALGAPGAPLGRQDTVTITVPDIAPHIAYRSLLFHPATGRPVPNRYFTRVLLDILDSTAASLKADGCYWVESDLGHLRIGDRVRAYRGDFERYEDTVVADGSLALARLHLIEAVASVGTLDGRPDYSGFRFERLARPGDVWTGA